MEKHKLELQKVREEFRIHEGDCGSSQVQSKLHHLLIVCEPCLEFFSSLKEGLRRNVDTESVYVNEEQQSYGDLLPWTTFKRFFRAGSQAISV